MVTPTTPPLFGISIGCGAMANSHSAAPSSHYTPSQMPSSMLESANFYVRQDPTSTVPSKRHFGLLVDEADVRTVVREQGTKWTRADTDERHLTSVAVQASSPLGLDYLKAPRVGCVAGRVKPPNAIHPACCVGSCAFSLPRHNNMSRQLVLLSFFVQSFLLWLIRLGYIGHNFLFCNNGLVYRSMSVL